jgi:hypothetical protein
MSLNTPQEITPIPPTLKQNWTDLNKDGRRMDQIIRLCMTQIKKKENDHDIILSYMDRLFRATGTKHKLALDVLGVKKILDEARK